MDAISETANVLRQAAEEASEQALVLRAGAIEANRLAEELEAKAVRQRAAAIALERMPPSSQREMSTGKFADRPQGFERDYG